MFVGKFAKEKWNPINAEYYKSKGYTYTKNHDILVVRLDDIFERSHAKILMKCDFCGKLYVGRYHEEKNRKLNNCRNKKCIIEKRKSTCVEKYGGPAPFSSEKVVQKARDNCMKKYGVSNYFKTEEGRKRLSENSRKSTKKRNETYKRTMQERYGVDNSFQLESSKKKMRATNIKNLGTPYPMQSLEVQIKAGDSYEKHYGEGVRNPMQSKEIRSKAMNTMIKQSHGTNVNTSKSQEHIWQILGGELNYKFLSRRIDIAFPEEKIALEYDGGGHFGFYKRNGLTDEQFEEMEQERENELLTVNWKIIRFINKKGKLPSDDKLKEIFNDCKEKLKTQNKVTIDFESLM